VLLGSPWQGRLLLIAFLGEARKVIRRQAKHAPIAIAKNKF